MCQFRNRVLLKTEVGHTNTQDWIAVNKIENRDIRFELPYCDICGNSNIMIFIWLVWFLLIFREKQFDNNEYAFVSLRSHLLNSMVLVVLQHSDKDTLFTASFCSQNDETFNINEHTGYFSGRTATLKTKHNKTICSVKFACYCNSREYAVDKIFHQMNNTKLFCHFRFSSTFTYFVCFSSFCLKMFGWVSNFP